MDLSLHPLLSHLLRGYPPYHLMKVSVINISVTWAWLIVKFLHYMDIHHHHIWRNCIPTPQKSLSSRIQRLKNSFSSSVAVFNNSVESQHSYKNHDIASSVTPNLGIAKRFTYLSQLNSDIHKKYYNMNYHHVNTHK